MSLIQFSPFISHSGLNLNWKIDCDFLSDQTIEEIAKIINSKLKFSGIHGIPQDGIRLANALRKYTIPNYSLLIVDDVLTTGNSMEIAKQELERFYPNPLGFVIFSRGKNPNWIWSLFNTNTSL